MDISLAYSAILDVVTTDWKIGDGTIDYNGDDNSYLLWRNDNGTVRQAWQDEWLQRPLEYICLVVAT